jgi:dethiobiotin synthetase
LKKIFVTAIGTGCGKTISSAILCEALKADYWKPVQSGLEDVDSEQVKQLVSNTETIFHPERYRLHTPVSPHAAAEIDKLEIKLSDFSLPNTNNQNLIIEGAGGVLVPLNYKQEYVIDLAQKFDSEIILVSNLYLGSINHTLLSIQELKRRNLFIKGIIFNGESNPASEKVILQDSGIKCLLRIEKEAFFTKNLVQQYAKKLQID